MWGCAPAHLKECLRPAGASGFMGRYLVDEFRSSGDEVLTIGRAGGDATWGDTVADGRRACHGMRIAECGHSSSGEGEVKWRG